MILLIGCLRLCKLKQGTHRILLHNFILLNVICMQVPTANTFGIIEKEPK